MNALTRTILTLFILSSNTAAIAQTDSQPQVYTIVEQKAEFVGGNEALNTYIASNLSYPETARDKGIQGVVYVSFVILETGKVSDVKVLRGIGGGCDEEAVRVVNSMPDWIPGSQRGKAVRIRYNLPIRFTLTKSKKKKKKNKK